jgi:hypothetical protein
MDSDFDTALPGGYPDSFPPPMAQVRSRRLPIQPDRHRVRGTLSSGANPLFGHDQEFGDSVGKGGEDGRDA